MCTCSDPLQLSICVCEREYVYVFGSSVATYVCVREREYVCVPGSSVASNVCV